MEKQSLIISTIPNSGGSDAIAIRDMSLALTRSPAKKA